MFKKFFKDVSPVPIIAGALAAVTSFLLSAHIGIAGSVIGVAIGSVVSAIASQVYQNVLRESGKKLQENLDFLPTSGAQVHDQRTGTQSDSSQDDDKQSSDDISRTRVMQAVDGEATQVQEPIESLEGHDDLSAAKGRVVQSSRVIHTPSRITVQNDTQARDTDFAHQNKKTKKKIIIVAVLSALLSVGVTAGIILAVTHGEGTDDVVRTIVVPKDSEQDQTSNTTGNYESSINKNGTSDNSNDSKNTTDGSESSDSSTSNSTQNNQQGSDSTSGSTNSGSTGSSSGQDSSSSDSTSGSDSTNSSSSDSSSSNSGSSSGSTGTSGSSGSSSNQGNSSSGSSSGSTSGSTSSNTSNSSR